MTTLSTPHLKNSLPRELLRGEPWLKAIPALTPLIPEELLISHRDMLIAVRGHRLKERLARRWLSLSLRRQGRPSREVCRKTLLEERSEERWGKETRNRTDNRVLIPPLASEESLLSVSL